MVLRCKAVRACVFDAYGTLFDVASASERCQGVPGDKVPNLASLWREKQLQYTWLRTIQGRHADFWQVTGDALDYSLEALQIADARLRDQLMECYLQLDAFAEVPAALQALRQSGRSIAILSNGTPQMLAAAAEHAGIDRYLDLVISVEQVGAYKPHPKVYASAAEQLNLTSDQICFVSSNAWDAYAASAYGMQVIWCNRYAQRAERLPGLPDAEVRDLGQAASLFLDG